jgi:hypothetical protein
MFVFPMIINTGFIGVGGLIIKFGLNNLHFYNKIKHLATSKIKSLAAGEVEIKGTITPNPKAPLLSPIKKTKCVSYNLKTYEWIKKSKNSNWVLIHEKTVNQPFYLSDDTGYILINPDGAMIRNDNHSTVQGNELLPEITGELDKNISITKTPEFLKKLSKFNGRYKFKEICVPEGESIYVMGYTVENPNIINNPDVQRLMIAKKDKNDFLITDEKEEELQKIYLLNAITLLIIGLFLVFFGLIQIFNIIDWISFIGGF